MNRARLAVVSAALALTAACGGFPSANDSGSGGDGEGRREITVSAAASLTDVFTRIADAFEDRHPGVRVRLDFGSSTSLVTRITDGAPIDVLAVADTTTMEKATQDDLLAGPTATFATNRMQLVTPRSDPGRVDDLEDLADPARVIALCAPDVPCGRLARRILDKAGVVPSLDSEEPDARSLLTKIASGDIDAGLVYRTDAAAAGDRVDAVDLPRDVDLSTAYPIGAVRGAPQPGLAADFVDFVRSAAGQDILGRAGFGPP